MAYVSENSEIYFLYLIGVIMSVSACCRARRSIQIQSQRLPGRRMHLDGRRNRRRVRPPGLPRHPRRHRHHHPERPRHGTQGIVGRGRHSDDVCSAIP
eukprot:scaffold182050_cov18-Prasinocladus_malaysianus.AAC.1